MVIGLFLLTQEAWPGVRAVLRETLARKAARVVLFSERPRLQSSCSDLANLRLQFSLLIRRPYCLKDTNAYHSFSGDIMREQTSILVPIRYPLTDQGARTLAAAGRMAQEYDPADLTVLHVNLIQNGRSTKTEELTEAISSALDDVEALVTTRQGFLVEEVILEEAAQIDADVIVVGANQRAIWRRFLSRLLGNSPEVGSFLRTHTTNEIEILEVDDLAESRIAQPV